MLAPRLVTNLCHGIFDRGQFIGVSGALKTDTLFYCRAILHDRDQSMQVTFWIDDTYHFGSTRVKEIDTLSERLPS